MGSKRKTYELLISIDPGKHEAGSAVFWDGTLVGVAFSGKTGDPYAEADVGPPEVCTGLDLAGKTLAQLEAPAATKALLDAESEHGVEGFNFKLTVAYERMEARSSKRSAHRNLTELSEMAGVFIGRIANTNFDDYFLSRVSRAVVDYSGKVVPTLPSRWTGKLSKSQHQSRTMGSLTDAERELVGEAGYADNSEVIDAIGIGLYRLGRV